MLFCKGKIPRLKLCKTCRVPFVPDAAGQIDGQHECAAFPLTIHQRTGSQPGRAMAAVKPGAIQSIHDGVKGLCCQRCRIAAFGDRQVCQACITLSELLRHYGVDVSDKGISKWEKGYTAPSIYQLVAICHALNIKEGPSYFTKAFQKPALLNDIGQKKLPSTKWT